MSLLAGYLSLNGNMRDGDVGHRAYRLPRAAALPKFDRAWVTSISQSNFAKAEVTGRRLHVRLCDAGPLPEMTAELVSAAECGQTRNHRRVAGWSMATGWLGRVLGAR
ncbi:MAG: hypothetical protein NZ483_06875 [Verrucomicrobiae bacterium]|nr:hypothetical protein [Verrucomicrobiae bacterium]